MPVNTIFSWSRTKDKWDLVRLAISLGEGLEVKCVTMFEGYHWPLDFWKMTSYVVIVIFLETELTRFRPVVPSEHPPQRADDLLL